MHPSCWTVKDNRRRQQPHYLAHHQHRILCHGRLMYFDGKVKQHVSGSLSMYYTKWSVIQSYVCCNTHVMTTILNRFVNYSCWLYTKSLLSESPFRTEKSFRADLRGWQCYVQLNPILHWRIKLPQLWLSYIIKYIENEINSTTLLRIAFLIWFK